MSCVVRWWDLLFVKGMHFSSKNARLLNYLPNFKTRILNNITNDHSRPLVLFSVSFKQKIN